MQAGKIKLTDIFQDNLTLIVPVYQRNYDWREEQCIKLFEDLKKTIDNQNEHFMGAIVCQNKKLSGKFNEYIIVDGQQRISSVVILAKALYDSTKDEAVKSSLQMKFFKHCQAIMFNAPTVVYLTLTKKCVQFSFLDLGAFEMAICLAAKSHGIDSVIANSTVLYPDVVRKYAKIPDDEFVVMGIALGYEDNNELNNFRAKKMNLDEGCHFIS